jgi:hypothetical protein
MESLRQPETFAHHESSNAIALGRKLSFVTCHLLFNLSSVTCHLLSDREAFFAGNGIGSEWSVGAL